LDTGLPNPLPHPVKLLCVGGEEMHATKIELDRGANINGSVLKTIWLDIDWIGVDRRHLLS